MIPYAALADATLARGVMPAVVPQLKSITLGGAVAGVGIEASSFRRGLVHDTVTALDVLTPDGRIVRCTPDNDHRDLFFGFPNSYGTLGYALAVTAKTVPVKRYVHVAHVRHSDAAACFAEIARHCAEGRLDFLDGTVFGAGEMYLTLGRFVDDAPWTSDYTFERIYYRSIRERDSDYLDDARLPLAMGHRLVLVLEERQARSIRSCGGCSAGSVSIRSRTRRSCAGTADGASPACSTASPAGMPRR